MARSGRAKARAKRNGFAAAAAMAPSRTNSRSTGSSYPHELGNTEARFTMQQEAHNTARHSLSWSTSKLRYNKINFVKAGDMQLNKLNDEAKPAHQESYEADAAVPSEEPKAAGATEGDMQDTADVLFFVDSNGNKPVTTGLVDPIARLDLSSGEDSSEDEVVFPGRNPHNSGYGRSREKSRDNVRKYEDKVDNLPLTVSGKDRSMEQNTVRETHSGRVSHDGEPSAPDASESNSIEYTPGLHSPTVPGRPSRSSSRSRGRKSFSNDQADVFADYIENIDPEYQDFHSLLDQRSVTTGVGGAGIQNGHLGRNRNKTSALLDSDDEDQPQNESCRVQGQTSEPLTKEPEQQYREGRKSDISHSDDDLMSCSSSEIEEHSVSECERLSEDDPEDYTDEQIARALQMQDGLGIALDEILLFDDGTLNPRASQNADLNTEKPSSERSKRRNKTSGGNRFVSASALADALEEDPYYGFDIMDFSRPSLRKKPKGRRQGLNFELTDSELEAELEAELESAWRNDREKKKIKKQKREELRSQGLLGRKPGKVDMKSKYSKGIGIDSLKLEIRSFLLSSADSLPLPPMDKKYRKLVHEIANAVSLKSQSRGSGSSRFPVLYKTSRTPKFTERNISDIERAFSKGRIRGNLAGKASQSATKGRRGGPGAAASYADGDIVGASAPEIGAENKGRAMLEKMGWSSGTALGAHHNKGILHPVAHVVKNSRTGLG